MRIAGDRIPNLMPASHTSGWCILSIAWQWVCTIFHVKHRKMAQRTLGYEGNVPPKPLLRIPMNPLIFQGVNAELIGRFWGWLGTTPPQNRHSAVDGRDPFCTGRIWH
jgi:hypothetical protein